MVTETTIRTHKGRDLEAATQAARKEVEAMSAEGWLVTNSTWADGRSGCLRVILLGFIGALVWKPKGTLALTYQRQSGSN